MELVRYEVTGSASSVTITTVINEFDETAVYSNVTLPWSYEYKSRTHAMYPLVYLKVVAGAPGPIIL